MHLYLCRHSSVSVRVSYKQTVPTIESKTEDEDYYLIKYESTLKLKYSTFIYHKNSLYWSRYPVLHRHQQPKPKYHQQ